MKQEKQNHVTGIIQALNINLKISESNKDTSKQENVIRKAAKKLYEDFLHIAEKKLSKENKLRRERNEDNNRFEYAKA